MNGVGHQASRVIGFHFITGQTVEGLVRCHKSVAEVSLGILQATRLDQSRREDGSYSIDV